MCGRYASARKRIELLEEFRIERDRVPEPLEPDYNVAPTKRVYAVVTRDARPSEAAEEAAERAEQGTDATDASAGAAAAAEGVARELRVVRWGLVPFWAKDPSIGSRMINARAETVQSKPAFRQAFKRRRCLLPADGYYEWQRLDGAGGSADFLPVGGAEQARVHQQRMQLMQRDPGPPARRERRRVVVSGQNAVQVGSAEQGQHGQVGLAVTAVRRGVDEPAPVAGPQHVPGPAVTVDPARRLGRAGQSAASGVLSSGRPAMNPGHGAPKVSAPAACRRARSVPKPNAASGVAGPGGIIEMTSACGPTASTFGTGTEAASASQRRPFASAANTVAAGSGPGR